jgi:hypothetical protein
MPSSIRARFGEFGGNSIDVTQLSASTNSTLRPTRSATNAWPHYRHDEIGRGDSHAAWRRVIAVDADLGVGVLEIGCDSTPSGAVSEDRDALAVRDPIGDPNVVIQHALPGGVFVLGELLDGTVVDHENRHT